MYRKAVEAGIPYHAAPVHRFIQQIKLGYKLYAKGDKSLNPDPVGANVMRELTLDLFPDHPRVRNAYLSLEAKETSTHDLDEEIHQSEKAAAEEEASVTSVDLSDDVESQLGKLRKKAKAAVCE